MSKGTLSRRNWLSLILVGLFGQFAWTIENMYFNVFLYNTITTDPNAVAAMVAASAVAATVTTLLMGALSDRLGRRKAFIVGGYLLWGLATAAFGLVSVENAARFFPGQAAAAAAMAVIVLDCVMTVFGSTANDAAFNAYVNDVVPAGQRGRVESVLAILPLLSMLVIFGLFDGMTRQGQWSRFFAIFGFSVSAVGLLSVWLLREAPGLRPRRENYGRLLLYGFRPAVLRRHPALYLALTALGLFSVAVQVFFPYLIIYMQHFLQLDNYALVLGVVLLAASAVSVGCGGLIDRLGRLRFTLPAWAVMSVGLLGMYLVRGFAGAIAAGIVMMSGYMLLTATLTATVREHTPPDLAGHFQGIRMIFAVLLPMLLGPFIGSAVIQNSTAGTYTELGTVKNVPTPEIFLAACVVLALTLLPVWRLNQQTKHKENMG